MKINFRNILASLLVILCATLSDKPASFAQDDNQAADDSSVVKTFKPQHLSAAEIVTQLQNMLFAAEIEEGTKIAVDERTNTLIVRAPASLYKQIERLYRHLDQPNPAQAGEEGRLQIKIIRLQHASADAAQSMLQELYANEFTAGGAKLATDGRTNSLIVRAPASLLETIEAIIVNLEEHNAKLPKASSTANGPSLDDNPAGDKGKLQKKIIRFQRMPAGEAQTVLEQGGYPNTEFASDKGTNSLFVRAPAPILEIIEARATGLDGLWRSYRARRTPNQSTEFQQYELQAQAFAQAYREQFAATPRDDARLKSDLQGAVHSAFHARLTWQRNQVAQMRKRLDEIEKNVADRSQRSNEIVERHVEELLNPEREWESPEPLETPDVPDAGSADLPNDLSKLSANPNFSRTTFADDKKRAGSSRLDAGTDPRRALLEAENALDLARAAVEAASIDAHAAEETYGKFFAAKERGTVPEAKVDEARVERQRKAAGLVLAQANLKGKERLLELAREQLAVQVERAAYDVKMAQAQLGLASRDDARARELMNKGVMTAQEFDRIQANLRQAQLNVEQAQAAYGLLSRALPGKSPGQANEKLDRPQDQKGRTD